MHPRPTKKHFDSNARLGLVLLGISLVCCVFEGAARKWLVGDASLAGRVAYLSKDIVLACLLLLGPGHLNRFSRGAVPLFAAGLVVLSAGALISAASGVQPLGTILTIRTFFVLPLAAWIGGRVLPPDALKKFAVWIALLSSPMAALGALQFYAPSSSPLNRYSTMEAKTYIATASVSARTRATGTFSFLTGLADFSAVAVWAGLVTLTLARTTRERWLGYVGSAAGACCALVTVSRTPVLIGLGLIAVWILAGGNFGRKAQMAMAVGAVVFVALLLSGRWHEAEEVTSTVYMRHQSNARDSFGYRLWFQFVLPLEAVTIAPLGEGLGSQQVASSLSANVRRYRAAIESYWGRTILELGVIGLGGFLLSCGAVLAVLLAAYRASPRGEARTVIAVTGAALCARLLAGIQYNHVAAYFFWAMAATALASCYSLAFGKRVTIRSSVMPTVMPNRLLKNPGRDCTL